MGTQGFQIGSPFSVLRVWTVETLAADEHLSKWGSEVWAPSLEVVYHDVIVGFYTHSKLTAWRPPDLLGTL